MTKWEDYLEEGHLAKILTVGGIIAVVIGSSYLIRGYLDFLRIKLIKEELKAVKKGKMPEENLALEDE